MKHFDIRSDDFFADEEASKETINVRIPKVALVRDKLKVIKGCLSETDEILEAIIDTTASRYSDDGSLEDLWPGILVGRLLPEITKIHDEEKMLEEFVDQLFYNLSVLSMYPTEKINAIIQGVIDKNYARGYYTQKDYERDATRGF